MLCASAAGALAVAPAAQCSTPSRPLHRHPRAGVLPPCASNVSPLFLLADGALRRSVRPPLAARLPRSAATAAAEAAEEALDATTDAVDEAKERLEVVVKGAEQKPRLVLRFRWMEKNIGLALDLMIPGQGTIPLSPYYFWPRKDAWEELKALLEGKTWISQKRMIILLNQATDIINLWQQSGVGNLQQ